MIQHRKNAVDLTGSSCVKTDGSREIERIPANNNQRTRHQVWGSGRALLGLSQHLDHDSRCFFFCPSLLAFQSNPCYLIFFTASKQFCFLSSPAKCSCPCRRHASQRAGRLYQSTSTYTHTHREGGPCGLS